MDKVEELLTRGVANIIPSSEELKKKLESGGKLNIYFGIDPTTTKIHLGHSVSIRKIQKLAELGHNVTFLIGDFTALVGDTSDKDSERPVLTRGEIEENFQTYKKQAEKILDFSKVKVRHNSEWLAKLTYSEIFSIKQQFTLNDFISRELIKKRLTEGKSVRLDETEYPIMQGYDSYFMDTDIQIGGTDQIFNMQAGRTLQKKLRGKESYILATEFIMGTDGRKMSKTWNNAIWLEDKPFEMFRKIMAINDDQIKNYFLLGTSIPMDQVPNDQEISDKPLEAKKKLAYAIVSELYEDVDAEKAEAEFERTVQKGELPEKVSEANVRSERLIDENLLIELGFVISRAQAKRLFEQDGVRLDGKQIRSGQTLKDEKREGLVLSIGKRVVRLKMNG